MFRLMARILAVTLSLLCSQSAFAVTGASYVDLSMRENRYLGDVQMPSQANNYSVFAADLNLETQSPGFIFKFNPVGQGTVEMAQETYFGVPELYIQPRKIAPGFNLTIGRQKRTWSRLDQEFNLGMWQPQLRWDYLAPKQQGLMGVFFEWSLSSAVRFTFFMSPLFLPDQGPQYQLNNGQFTSANRWFSPPQGRVKLFSSTPFASEAPLYFAIERPAEEAIVMNSSFGFSMQYQSSGPLWSQLSYAFKPRNQIHLGIECANCATVPQIEITARIHPKIVKHNIITWEAGFDRVDDRGWVSLSGDFPLRSGFPQGYAEAPLNNTIVAGAAYQHYLKAWTGIPSWLEYSYMRVYEFRRPGSTGVLGEEDVQSSWDRYPFRELAAADYRLLIRQTQDNRLHWRNRYTYSFPERGGWWTSSLEWTQGPMTWVLGADVLGSNVDASSRDAGLFTRYRNNDRVFGGLNYVF
jgi:hypothetical protein